VDLIAESFNLLNRDNKSALITEDGFESNSTYFVKIGNKLGINYFPGHYQIPTSPLRFLDSYPPRQVQFALRLSF